jgi:hypothetical protein
MTGRWEAKADNRLAMSCKLFTVPLLLAIALQAQIKAPQMGAVRCADGSVRPVYGVPGAFVLGTPIATSAIGASFSGEAGIIATPSAILLVDANSKVIGRQTIADAGAVVGIETDSSSAIAWLPRSSSLLIWNGGSFGRIAVSDPPHGRVLSLRRDSAQAYLTVIDETRSVSEFSISLRSGEVVSQRYVPGATGAALTLGSSSLVVSGTGGLALETAAGTQAVPLAGAGLALERMSDGWVHVTAVNPQKTWAVHFNGDVATSYELPGTAGLLEPR